MTDTAAPATDEARLTRLVEVWHETALSVSDLLRSLDASDWDRPTDLPGWDVRCVAAHLAHLESELAGNPQREVDVPEAPHVRGLMGQFTEAGPIARADWSTAAILDELESSVATRYAALRAEPPTDADAPGPGFAGAIGWSWQTLLSNRPLDMWMHEQDIRRAVDQPGGFHLAAAEHVVGVFTGALPFVLGKRAGASPGQSVRLVVTGTPGADVAAVVGDDGRAVPLAEPPADPTVTLEMDVEAYIVRCGGRRGVEQIDVSVSGDADLAGRLLTGMATTP